MDATNNTLISTGERTAERGFTVIEMMVAVSVLGILGTLIVPSFVRESRKARYDSEVSAVFGELLEREDQHKIEFGAYHAAPQCPAMTNDSGTDVSDCMATGSDWSELKMQPTLRKLKCVYTVSTGCPSDIAAPPAGAKFDPGVASWTFVVALCGTGNDTYTYFASSTNPRIQKLRGNLAFQESQGCSTTVASAGGAGTGSTGTGSTGTGSTGTGSTGTGSTGTGSTGTGTSGTGGSGGSGGSGGKPNFGGGDGNGQSQVGNGNNTHSNCGGNGKCADSTGHTM